MHDTHDFDTVIQRSVENEIATDRPCARVRRDLRSGMTEEGVVRKQATLRLDSVEETIGCPAPSRTTPRARSGRSSLRSTLSYAIIEPTGGVTSASNAASLSSCAGAAMGIAAQVVNNNPTAANMFCR